MTKALLLSLVLATAASAQTTLDFNELDPAARPAFDANPGFASKGTTFAGGVYAGWSYSNVNDTTTAGFGNQYAAFTGTGLGGSGNYAIGYGSGPVTFAAGQRPTSVYLTNTTYAALSMLQGDSFAKKFGGASGNDADFFDVTFTGRSGVAGTGDVTGSVTFRLADYTFADNALDYVVRNWTQIDLTPLGNAASMNLSFASSDVGDFGINTPVYVAVDNLVTVPEPASLAGLAVAGGLLLRRRK